MLNPRCQKISQRLTDALKPSNLEIIDESHLHIGHAGAKGGGGHFKVIITANCFTGKTVLARHRLIYEALDDMMKSEIHALSIEALADS